ncbi:MAG: GNAT family N-acetyltransferase [Thermoplasmata archaeon]|nr:GNAT family N-acetyltransferase [Thermoplasmata archaeon]
MPEDRLAVTLRGFRPSDVPFIAAIVADSLHEHYDPGLYPSLSGEWPEGFLVAANPDEVPVGFLLGVSQVEREARVLMFAVDRQHREVGVGHLLMRTFLDRCRDRGYRRVTLEVRVSNATAIRFYARYQYSVIDLLKGYYSDGENGYQMARPLP